MAATATLCVRHDLDRPLFDSETLSMIFNAVIDLIIGQQEMTYFIGHDIFHW